ncbi:NtaA/DmoA family FMN-dependent monooxygenase [Nocardioides bruguierae]|uniref:NtaA/DmoA family FMN-dependent monooxygenase n=1 Tax=Nocardioides bruguierae TaxID=2945102 RepID=A0A9X2D8A0_9ACTN|nr:NtaA/DmoA family FMN-dependent monooxygenase [Nocardioides bruguierae]MCM0621138.1 NtaA/DmoA family FMN-dependent monooxygenase [Nocardioides bruguierae]
MSADPFHLAWFAADGFGVKSWGKTFSGRGGQDWADPALWIDLAQALERARFDFIIIEDSSYMPDTYGGTSEAYLKTATATPKMDPSVLAPLMSHATKKIGIVPTMSVSEHHPYGLARTINTLDHMSQGRTGWNIVTGSNDNAAKNYGLDDWLEHDERYDMADEFFDLACRLWTSWEEDAVVLDEATGTWGDFTKVHTVDFQGTYFSSRGPLNAPQSPQGLPTFVQAGGSPRGKKFDARAANAIISGVEGGPAKMKAFRDDIRAQAALAGRSPDDVKVLYLISPIIAETDEEAWAKRRRQTEFAEAHPEIGLLHLSRHSRIDFSQWDLDEVIPEGTTTNGHRQQLEQCIGKTPRQILREGFGQGNFEIVGSPDTVAAQLDEAMEEVGGDGFLIASRDLNRRYISEIADGLVPALQRRGVVREEYSHDTFRDNLLAF